jgi:hypothetical protein
MKRVIIFSVLIISLLASSFSIQAMLVNATRQRALRASSMVPLASRTVHQQIRIEPVSPTKTNFTSLIKKGTSASVIRPAVPMQQRRFYSNSYDQNKNAGNNKYEDMLSWWGWRARWFPWSPEYRARAAYDDIIIDLNRGIFPAKNKIILFCKNTPLASRHFLMERPLKDGHSVIFKFLSLIANQSWQQLIEDKNMDRIEIISSPHFLYGATLNDKDKKQLQVMCKRLIVEVNNNFLDTTPIRDLVKGASVLLGLSVYDVGFTKDAVKAVGDFIQHVIRNNEFLLRTRKIDTIAECKKQLKERKEQLNSMGSVGFLSKDHFYKSMLEAEILIREEFLKSAQAVKDALSDMFTYKNTTYARQDDNGGNNKHNNERQNNSRNSHDEDVDLDSLTLEKLRNILIARLNIKGNPSNAQITKKFRQESMKIHPDITKGSGDEFSELSRLYNAFNDKRLGRSEARLK